MELLFRSSRDVSGKLRRYLPGLVLAFTIAAAATFLSEHYAAPVMLFALLIGMAFNFLSSEETCRPGIELTSKKLLRIGVALLGARVTIGQIASLGYEPIIIVLAGVVLTILFGYLTVRFFGRDKLFGLLTGGAVAICGASAALAISSVLPKSREGERDTLFTVIAVTGLSTLAMVFYPILFQAFGFTETEVGVLLGATIHDVAQVVGAGYAISDETGDVATYVKLLRVAMLPFVIGLMALAFRSSKTGDTSSSFPWFAVGFAVILLANSMGMLPDILRQVMQDLSRWFLVAAIAAIGVKTSIKAMTELGPMHVAVVVAETIFLAVLAMGLTHYLM